MSTLAYFVECRYRNRTNCPILYEADANVSVAEMTRRAHLACERQDARLCQLFCLDYWTHARIAPLENQKLRHTEPLGMDEFTESTPFEEAFPEACGIHDKLAEIIDKVQSGEMSLEEAKASLQEVKEINSAIRRKISLSRKAAALKRKTH